MAEINFDEIIKEVQAKKTQPKEFDFDEIIKEVEQSKKRTALQTALTPVSELITGKPISEQVGLPQFEVGEGLNLLEQLKLAVAEPPGEELTPALRRQIGAEAAARTALELADITPVDLSLLLGIPLVGKGISKVAGKVLKTEGIPQTVEQIKKAGLSAVESTKLFNAQMKLGRPLTKSELDTFIKKGLQRQEAQVAKFTQQLKDQSPELQGLTKEANQKLAQEFVDRFKLEIRPLTIQESKVSELAKQMIEAIKKAKPIRTEQEALFAQERAKRFAEAAAIGKETGGELGFLKEKGALGGELPKLKFESIRNQFSQENIDTLFDAIAKNTMFEQVETFPARAGLLKLLEGRIPTEGELALLKRAFGREFVQAAISKKTLFEKLSSLGGELAFDTSRAMMSSMDLSFLFNQAIVLSTRKEFWKNVLPSIKFLFNEKAFQASEKEILLRPTFQLMKSAKLKLKKLEAPLEQREEFFRSNLIDLLPGIRDVIRGSNRAYTGFLNKLSADMFDSVLASAKLAGRNIDDPKLIFTLADFINNAVGRGTLFGLEKSMLGLSRVMFAPGLLGSTIRLMNPRFYVMLDPLVRKEALKSLIGSAALWSTIIGMSKLAGAKVELDPRSSDFAAIKIGNTRYKPAGRFTQIMVLITKLASNETKLLSTGEIKKLGDPKEFKPETRLSVATRFLTNKASPAVSLALELLRGETAIGEEVEIPQAVISRFVPFVLQDLWDIILDRGFEGIPMALPAIPGIATQTFKTGGSKRIKKLQKEVDFENFLRSIGIGG